MDDVEILVYLSKYRLHSAHWTRFRRKSFKIWRDPAFLQEKFNGVDNSVLLF